MRATQKIWLQVWRVVHIGQQGLVTHCQKQCQMNHVITRGLKHIDFFSQCVDWINFVLPLNVHDDDADDDDDDDDDERRL